MTGILCSPYMGHAVLRPEMAARLVIDVASEPPPPWWYRLLCRALAALNRMLPG